MENYINLSAFLIGVSTAFFTIFALHILFWRKARTRFQTVLGCIMAVWAVWNAKDLVITFPGMYRPEVLHWILIIDGWSALTYLVFVAEAVRPGWVSVRRLLLLALPFAAFTVTYAVWPSEWVTLGYVVFLWCFAWTVVIVGYVQVRRHLKYVRANYSNIDQIDVSWLKPVFLFAIVSQLAWLFTSLAGTVAGDIVYYISVLGLWLMVLYYSWDFRPITMTQDDEQADEQTDEPTDAPKTSLAPPHISEGQLEALVEGQQLYLNKDLTLTDLAQALHTNRTYVSNYLSQVRRQTFYDYINQLRIQRVSLPLMQEHPEYKLEYVASESGFASISTFRRAFVKFTGQTPSQFEAPEYL